MGLFDFMGQDIGGYSNAVNDPGGLGVSQGAGNAGINWGQLISAAMRYGGRGSTPAVGGIMGQQYGNNQAYKQNVPVYTLPSVIDPQAQQQQQQQKKGNDMGDISSILSIAKLLLV